MYNDAVTNKMILVDIDNLDSYPDQLYLTVTKITNNLEEWIQRSSIVIIQVLLKKRKRDKNEK